MRCHFLFHLAGRATERLRLGPFGRRGMRARERLSPPRREASNDPFEDGGDQDGDRCNRGPVLAGCVTGDHGMKRVAGAGLGGVAGGVLGFTAGSSSPGSRPR